VYKKKKESPLLAFVDKHVRLGGQVGLVCHRPPDGRRGKGFELHVIDNVNDFTVPVRHIPLETSDATWMVEEDRKG